MFLVCQPDPKASVAGLFKKLFPEMQKAHPTAFAPWQKRAGATSCLLPGCDKPSGLIYIYI